jgi:hypothetical protein
MFQAVGHPVSKLRRVAIGPLSDPKLTPGMWRELTKQEVKMLATMQEAPKAKAKPHRGPAKAAAKKKGVVATAGRAKTAARTASAPRPPGSARKAAPGSSRKAATGSSRKPAVVGRPKAGTRQARAAGARQSTRGRG